MIKLSKKMLALIMSMLMIFSCMAVSASAEGETAPVTIQIPEPVWVFEQETMSFFVEKPMNIHYPEDSSTYYPVEITVEPEAELIKNEDGSYIIESIELGKEYTITAAIVDETNTVTGSSSVTAAPVITVPGTKDICTFNEADRSIIVEKIDNIVIDGAEFAVVAVIEPATSNMYLEDGSKMFYNLEYGKTYTVKAMVQPGADAKMYYSEDNFTVTVKDKQDAPSTPVPSAITSNSITVVAAAGCQYALKGADGKFIVDWTDSTGKDAILFNNLKSETEYTVLAKKKATEALYESAESSITVTTKKAGTTATPTLTLEDKSDTTITVKADGDVEYKLNDGAWQASGEFKGLKADTQYNIYARYAFDAAKQDPSAVSEALIVKTNAVANYEADEKKISFSGENGEYANAEISFTVTGDGPADMNKVVYGDTRIVPVSYKVVFGSEEIKGVTAWDTQKVTNSGSFTAEAYAEKVVTVKVTFEFQEYKGKNADGTANWVTSKTTEKSFDIELGRINSSETKILEFFEGIANFLFNVIPAFFAEALQSDVWARLIKALGALGGAMG